MFLLFEWKSTGRTLPSQFNKFDFTQDGIQCTFALGWLFHKMDPSNLTLPNSSTCFSPLKWWPTGIRIYSGWAVGQRHGPSDEPKEIRTQELKNSDKTSYQNLRISMQFSNSHWFWSLQSLTSELSECIPELAKQAFRRCKGLFKRRGKVQQGWHSSIRVGG